MAPIGWEELLNVKSVGTFWVVIRRQFPLKTTQNKDEIKTSQNKEDIKTTQNKEEIKTTQTKEDINTI